MNSGLIFSDMPLCLGDDEKTLLQRRKQRGMELRGTVPSLD